MAETIWSTWITPRKRRPAGAPLRDLRRGTDARASSASSAIISLRGARRRSASAGHHQHAPREVLHNLHVVAHHQNRRPARFRAAILSMISMHPGSPGPWWARPGSSHPARRPSATPARCAPLAPAHGKGVCVPVKAKLPPTRTQAALALGGSSTVSSSPKRISSGWCSGRSAGPDSERESPPTAPGG